MKVNSFERQLTLGLMVALSVSILSTGCSHAPKPKPKKEKAFAVSYRQNAPEPVYSRLRWGHLPEVIPQQAATNASMQQAPYVMPIINLELKNATLEEAAKVLAGAARYGSYCASSIADERITINTLGTIDELASQISQMANINAVVDHENREIRFTSGVSEGGNPQPRLFTNG